MNIVEAVKENSELHIKLGNIQMHAMNLALDCDVLKAENEQLKQEIKKLKGEDNDGADMQPNS